MSLNITEDNLSEKEIFNIKKGYLDLYTNTTIKRQR